MLVSKLVAPLIWLAIAQPQGCSLRVRRVVLGGRNDERLAFVLKDFVLGSYAEQRGVQVLWGWCYEGEGRRDYYSYQHRNRVVNPPREPAVLPDLREQHAADRYDERCSEHTWPGRTPNPSS